MEIKLLKEKKPTKKQQEKIDKALSKIKETERDKRRRAAEATQLY